MSKLPKEIFDLRLHNIISELRVLKEHLALMERQVEEIQRSEDAKFAEELRNMKITPEDVEWDMEHREHGYWSELSLARMFRGPFLISAFSVFECSVIEVSHKLQRQVRQEISIDDLRGEFFERAKKYYKNVLKFDLCLNNDNWAFLQKIYPLRHVFAHANGRIDMLRASQRASIMKLESSDVGVSQLFDYVIVEKRLLQRLVAVIDGSLSDLVNRYKDWDDSRRTNLDQTTVAT